MAAFSTPLRQLAYMALLALVLGAPASARAQDMGDEDRADVATPTKAPQTYDQLMASIQIVPANKKKEDGNLELRMDGLKEASLSYGARAGLASRTFEIRQTLLEKEAYLDRIYDFKRLLVPAPSGLLIEPPVISEAEDAMLIGDQGQTAAVADRIYNINVDAKIVAAPRNWRAYLERDWGDVTPPPSILYPSTKEELAYWLKHLKEGWLQGVGQADDVFQADLDRLNADFRGQVRYRMLLSQGIVSPPYTLQTDRGVTGGGKEMRVGDRALQITGPSQLQTGAYEWRPASQ